MSLRTLLVCAALSVVAMLLGAGFIPAAVFGVVLLGGQVIIARRSRAAAQKRILRLFLDHRGDSEGGWLDFGQILRETGLNRRRAIGALYVLHDGNWLQQERIPDDMIQISMALPHLHRNRLGYNKVEEAKQKLAA